MQGSIDTYEFRRLGKSEVKDRNYTAKWDQNGRYFCINGRRATNFDKSAKTVRFYNMFGELLDYEDEIKELGQVLFRPRPSDILPAGKIKALKKDFKKKYEKIFKEEEQQDKKIQLDIVKEKKKEIREDFLNNFFLPLREKYEKNIQNFKDLFPIKDKDMETEETSYYSIY